MTENKYFAAQDSEKAAEIILKKADFWGRALLSTRYLEKCKQSWRAYNGVYFDENSDGHEVSFGGEQGEYSQLPVNHFRNIATILHNMTTSTRPAMEAIANNTDFKTLAQTKLANGLLNYYMSEKRLEEYLKNAAEYAIVLGEGYLKIEWDSSGGDPYVFNEETQTMIYEGDIKFTNFSAFDVIRDTSREDQDHDWLAVRTFRNRHDLIAKYPEFQKEIEGLEAKGDADAVFQMTSGQDQTELVAVWEFYHKRSDSVPDGRFMLFITPEAVFYDGALPYRFIPVFRMSPANIIGTPFGYTPMFDLMPLQEAINSLYSTVLSNQNAFGVQSIISPKGSDITAQSLAGGLNFIEYEPGAGKPEPLQLTQTPAEVFRFMERLIQDMETLSGINSVARGNPEASLKSGAALALVQAQAVQFASGLQQSFIRLIEDIGSAIIKLLQDFATVPRVAAIVGKSNKAYLRSFKAEDLKDINRVRVTVANPLSKTTAGRLEMANNLLQMGIIKTAEHYLTIVNTGSLDVATEGEQSELLLIKKENEAMMEGKRVPVTAIDEHILHIKEHRAVLADPDLRTDQELVSVVLDHIQEHINALKTVDPGLLQIIGQQPLPPDQPPGGQQSAPQGEPQGPAKVTNEQAKAADGVAEQVQEPLPVGVEQANEVRQPNMPKPAGEFAGEPIDAQAQMAQMIDQGE